MHSHFINYNLSHLCKIIKGNIEFITNIIARKIVVSQISLNYQVRFVDLSASDLFLQSS